jgi:hypothetical protein
VFLEIGQMKRLSNYHIKLSKALLISLPISLLMWAGMISLAFGAAPATYYVDCNANGDAGAGTGTGAAVAWKTVNKVNTSTFNAGDQILFNKGCTWREQLTVPSSGSAGSPITFGAYGNGESPIITGADIVSSFTSEEQVTNTNYGNTTYNQAYGTPGANYIYWMPVGSVTTGGTVTQAKIYIGATAAAASKVALYSDDGSGKPGTLVANGTSNELSQSTGAWNTYTFGTNPTVSSSTSYWIGVNANAGYTWSGGSSTTTGYYQSRAYGSFPSTATPSQWSTSLIAGVYITVQATDGVTFYYAGSYTNNPNGVIYNGTLLRNTSTKTNLTNSGYWHYDADNDRVYIGDNPSGATVEIATRSYGIDTNGKSYLTFNNLNVQSGKSYSILFNDSSGNISVDNCTLKNGNYGIGSSASAGNTFSVDKNSLSYFYNSGILSGASTQTGWIVSNNSVTYTGRLGEQIIGSTYPVSIQMVGKSTVEGNTVAHNNLDYCNAGHYPAVASMQAIGIGDGGIDASAATSIIRWNYIYDNAWSGLELMTGSDGSQVYGNIISNNVVGIQVFNISSATIYNNTIWANNDKGTGISVGFGIVLYNSLGNPTVTGIKNNIIGNNYNANNGANPYTYQIVLFSGATLSASDYNLFYATGNPSNLFLVSGAVKTLTEWKALGFDDHSLNTEPFLTASYGIAGNSPAKNAGVPLWTYAAYPGDYLGNKIYGSAPDIGAVEKKQFIFDEDEMIGKKCKSTNAACYVQPE